MCPAQWLDVLVVWVWAWAWISSSSSRIALHSLCILHLQAQGRPVVDLSVTPLPGLHACQNWDCGQVAVMTPGMYELSDYSLSWASADPGRQADGLYNGRPFLLRVNV